MKLKHTNLNGEIVWKSNWTMCNYFYEKLLELIKKWIQYIIIWRIAKIAYKTKCFIILHFII